MAVISNEQKVTFLEIIRERKGDLFGSFTAKLKPKAPNIMKPLKKRKVCSVTDLTGENDGQMESAKARKYQLQIEHFELKNYELKLRIQNLENGLGVPHQYSLDTPSLFLGTYTPSCDEGRPSSSTSAPANIVGSIPPFEDIFSGSVEYQTLP